MRKNVPIYLAIAVFVMVLALPLLQMIFPFAVIPPIWENRYKTVLPVFKSETLEDGRYMSDYNQYFNDHFGFRDLLIRANRYIDYYILGISSSPLVIRGKDGFLFYNGTLNDYNHIPTLTEQDCDAIALKLRRLQDELKAQGVRFLFFVGPNSNTLYGEKMPFPPENPSGSTNYQRIKASLDKFGVEYLDLVPYLLKAKEKYPVYYKRDTHWNLVAGALVGDEILKRLNRKDSEQYIRIKGLVPEVRKGDLNIMLGIDPKEIAQKPVVELEHRNERFSKVVWLHDSFSWAVFPYVSPYLDDLKELHYVEAGSYAQVSSNMPKAKVLILEITERELPYLKKMRCNFLHDQVLWAKLHHLDCTPDQCWFKNQIGMVAKGDSERMIATGADPQLVWQFPHEIPAKYLELDMSTPTESLVQIFWANTGDKGFTEAKSTYILSGPYRTHYFFDLRKVGKIKYLRVDPCNQEKMKFQFVQARILY